MAIGAERPPLIRERKYVVLGDKEIAVDNVSCDRPPTQRRVPHKWPDDCSSVQIG